MSPINGLEHYITSLLSASHMEAPKPIQQKISRHIASDIKALVELVEAAALRDGVKTVSNKHVTGCLDMLYTRSQKGGRVSLPAEFFGDSSGRYGAAAATGMEGASATVDFENAVARAEVAQTVLTGGHRAQRMSGGRVSMPSEFFGDQSGRYGAAATPISADRVDFANVLARPALNLIITGGSHALPLVPRSAIHRAFTMRVSKEALVSMQDALQKHVRLLLKDLRGRSKGTISVSDAKISRVLDMKRHCMFAR